MKRYLNVFQVSIRSEGLVNYVVAADVYVRGTKKTKAQLKCPPYTSKFSNKKNLFINIYKNICYVYLEVH